MAKYALQGEEEKREYPKVPEGEILQATVLSVKEKETPFKDDITGEPVWNIEFNFSVTDGQYKGRRFWGNTPIWFSLHSECRLRNWAQEILGLDDLPVGFELDTDQLVGAPCRIVIAHRKTSGKEFVGDVIRASRGAMVANEVF